MATVLGSAIRLAQTASGFPPVPADRRSSGRPGRSGWGAIDGGAFRAINVRHDEPIGSLGDGSHRNAGLADRRDDFDQGHFTPRSSAAEHADGGLSGCGLNGTGMLAPGPPLAEDAGFTTMVLSNPAPA